MGELENMIGKILEDPEQMARITGLASQLMGGGEDRTESPSEGGNPGLPESLGRMLAMAQGRDSKAELVSALAPYLRPERRSKLEKAMRISRLARMAGLALEEYGEGIFDV